MAGQKADFVCVRVCARIVVCSGSVVSLVRSDIGPIPSAGAGQLGSSPWMMAFSSV